MIKWIDATMIGRADGYGSVSDNLWNIFKESGLPIERLQPHIDQSIEKMHYNNLGIGYTRILPSNQDGIVINHCTPNEFINFKNYSVGMTYWETNLFPIDWIDNCNRMDEIWTTSKAMKHVFINSGITKPVYNFELGVDPKIYFPQKRTPHNQFTFLSLGSPATRKNSQLSVNAFLKVFGDNNNYELIYKSNGPQDARIYKNGIMHPLEHPRIKVINHEVTTEELGAIYDKADCLLYPTSGEGWGLIPFQAIAKGIPTICTNALACTEFADMSVPLDFKWGTKNMTGIYQNAGEWAEPNFDDLCDKMLYVVNNYAKVCDKTYQGAEFINQNMTWEKVSQKYIKRMKIILDQAK